MLKVLKYTYVALFTLWFVWFALSFADIVMDNCSMNPVHHPLNMFLMLKG